MPATPALRVHSLAQAVTVLRAAAGRPVRLVVGGPLGWAACAALKAAAEAAVPGARAEWLYDPAGRAGLAALALRQGAPAVLWPARDRRRPALEALARACGGRLETSLRMKEKLAPLRRPGGLPPGRQRP